MEKFKFDPSIDRSMIMEMMYNASYRDEEYPDVAVIFKTLTPDEDCCYSGSISISLLEKLFTDPSYKINIIDKMHLLNCPDPMLSEGLRKLQDLREIDCTLVRTHPQHCVNGFGICGGTAVGEEIFPSGCNIVQVKVNAFSTSNVPIFLGQNIFRNPKSGDYYCELREDLVYFISCLGRVEIYCPKSMSLPYNIDSEVSSTIDEKDSWINKVIMVRQGIETMQDMDNSVMTSMNSFLYKQDSFNVLDFADLIRELLAEAEINSEITHHFS